MNHRVLFAILALTTLSVSQAADDELGWSSSGEGGYVGTRGNSETESLKLGLSAGYNLETWRHSGFFNALFSSENDIDTAKRFELGGQSDYKIDDRSYWFGSARYEDDQFSQFDFQATLAAGYGRELIDDEVHLLKGEAGLGYRTADIRTTGISQNEAIIRGVVDYRWTISDTAALTNKTLVEAGSDNTFGSNVTALETSISSGLGLKLAYEVRHNTDVTEPNNNSDFLTTVNLVFKFR